MRQWLCRGLSWGFLACLAPTISWSHSFGTPYVLPVPFWMYMYGCAATLIVTFALLGYFVGAPIAATPTEDIVEGRSANAVRTTYTVPRWLLWALRAGAAGCLSLAILAGLIGNTDPARNIGMTLFWVLFLLGCAYLTLFVGDVFALINPWKILVDGVERAGLNLSSSRINYSACLGYWPAFFLYVALIWIELFVAPRPFTLAIGLLTYTAITFAGAALFGKSIWFSKAEVFSVFFRLIGKLAPVEYIEEESSWRVRFRPPFTGVQNDKPAHITLVLFVLFMLSSTTYDAIHDTVLWVGFYWRNLLWLLQPLWGTDLGKAQNLLMDWYLVYRQLGLVIFPFLYLCLYVLVLMFAKALTRRDVSLRHLTLEFCYSLLPIALAYHFTHYFTYLIVQVQGLSALLSDPFGHGWNLLRIGRTAEPPPLQMSVIWHTQVAILVAGHVVSVYLAHKAAMRIFPTQGKALLSQLPLLLLMVVYTYTGLWILSLPLGTE